MKQKAIVGSILGLLVLVVVLMGIDVLFLNSRYFAQIYLGRDCDYYDPEFEVMYDIEEDVYAVRKIGTNDYLWDRGSYFTTMPANIAKPQTFLDSCNAKACIKQYRYQKHDRSQKFKKI